MQHSKEPLRVLGFPCMVPQPTTISHIRARQSPGITSLDVEGLRDMLGIIINNNNKYTFPVRRLGVFRDDLMIMIMITR